MKYSIYLNYHQYIDILASEPQAFLFLPFLLGKPLEDHCHQAPFGSLRRRKEAALLRGFPYLVLFSCFWVCDAVLASSL
jgi:hypothetical protein